jgi:hypothetical protein
VGVVRIVRLALAAAAVAAAAICLLAAHDALAWRSALHRGDATLAAHPRRASWAPSTWLPGDPVGHWLGLAHQVTLRRAVSSFEVAVTTPRGYDNGETQDIVRSAAEVRLSDVAAGEGDAAASQAGDLLGVLVERGGAVVGGVTADDRALDAFTTAARRDLSNADVLYNLELLLRRTRAASSRHGAGNGAGTRGRGQRGAGAGTPGRGY